MKNYAVIEDGNFVGFINDELYPKIPENAVEITDDVYQDYLANQTHRAWDNDNKTFKHITPPEPPMVYNDLTRRQFWQACLSIGITSDNIKASLTDPESKYYIENEYDRAGVIIDIDDTGTFSRDYYLIEDIAKANGLPDEQINALWKWAENIGA